ncbi:MAG: hypothetical protein PHV74_01545 [Dehalococcoidia bacterium]|nr:hypothetical protein [Dehalococcoidia bacterium]
MNRLIISISILVLILLGVCNGCSGGGGADSLKPSVRVVGIFLGDTSSATLTVDTTIEIDNPNPIGATLEKIECHVRFGHKEKWYLLGNGERGTLDISASSTTNLVVQVVEDKERSSLLMESLFGTDPSRLKVEGDAWLKVGADSYKVSFEKMVTNPLKT